MLRISRRNFASSTSIKALFEEKIALGKTLPKLDDNDTKLKMYALFKQATEGPCKQPKPGMFDFVGKAKWEAWTSLEPLSQDEAMQKYCHFIDELASKAGQPTSPNASKSDSPSKKQEGIQSAEKDGIITLISSTKDLDVSDLTEKIQSAAKTNPKALVLQLHDVPSKNDTDLNGLLASIVSFPAPIVSLVQGPASELGVSLASLSDVVFAHERATFEIPIGSNPSSIVSQALITKLGYTQANALLLLGDKLTAERAQQSGLVTRVFGEDFKRLVESHIKAISAQSVDLWKTCSFRFLDAKQL